MTQHDNTLRAVFLAALMFLWLFAGTVAFAGGAAAQSANSFEITDTDLDDEGFDTDASHELTHELDVDGDAGTLDELEVNYNDGGNFDGDVTNVGDDDITVQVAGDTVSGATVTDTTGNAVTIDTDSTDVPSDFTGTITVTIDNITNPSPGTYAVETTATTSNLADQTASADYEIDDGLGGDAAFTTDASLQYQGQELYVQADTDSFSDFRLIEYDKGASDFREARGDTETALSFNDNGGRLIDTEGLEGSYAITASDGTNRVAIQTNENGVQTGTTQSVSDEPYLEVTVQELDTAEFEDDNPDLDDDVDLEVESGRNGYDLVISEDNLSQDELEAAFPNAETEGDDDVIVTDVDEDDTITANFNDEDFAQGDEYSFDLDVDDTTASASASVTLGEDLNPEATFDEGQITQERGDIFEVSFELTQAKEVNVTFGNIDDAGVEANYRVEANSDDEVTMEVNSFEFLRDSSDPLAGVEFTDGSVDEANSSVDISGSSNQLDQVLAPGLYDVVVESTNGTELGVAVVDLTERESTEMTIHTYEDGSLADIDDLDGIQEALGEGALAQADEVSVQDPSRDTGTGDIIVHRVVSSGLEGVYANQQTSSNTDLEALAELEDSSSPRDPGASSIYLDFFQASEQQNVGGFSASLNDLAGSDGTELVVDADNDTFYVILDTDTLAGTDTDLVEPGTPYQVDFSVTPNYLNEFRGDRNQLNEEEQNEEVVGDNFSIVDRTVDFNTVGGEVTVEPTDGAEISGTTTVAPGTEVTVRARATGESPFLKTADATVQEDGSFSAEFDFSDVESGQEFTATIRNQGFEDGGETAGTVGEVEFASVTLSDVTATEGETVDTITVDSAFLPNGNGFVTIHDGTLLDGETIPSVRGTSDYLDSENPQNIEVTLDTPYEEDGTAIAMPHQDTNGNEEYDFVDTEGAEDGPYANEDGGAVVADASVTFEAEDTPTPTPDEPDETPEDTDTPDEDTETTESADDQPGFGAVVALVALLGAALLAARRRSLE